ncbi:uncharacterized protein LOC103721905 [Phoenix dactylifera]|uniref:Uncharacterized protein LOC103721905 n=1 Tax=Phoenix dactylifera TaxID=42345 RepID=A0A8B7D0K4_PHODC|nr:uncharacterized protein LOC103721905 [Phoenix dactylifera]
MSSVCTSSVGCVDARVPVRATYVNLYKWPESDAEFVKSVAGRSREGSDPSHNGSVDGRRKWGPSPRVVDSYSCRQMYLRSYTFSRKESFPEKTQRCLGKVKEKAAVCPFLHQRSDSFGSIHSSISHKDDEKRKKNNNNNNNNNKKKGCVAAKKFLNFIFRRLLFCTTSVDVADRSSPS